MDEGPSPIADDDFVIRKIEEAPHLKDDNQGGRRISKAAFSASSPGADPEKSMSCNSEQLLLAEGDMDQFSPTTPVLARLSVKALREELGLRVEPRPLDDDTSHCGVLDIKPAHRQKMLDLSELIRCPQDVHK